VDIAAAFEIMDEIRDTFPSEFAQARQIVRERQSLLDDAEAEANRMIEDARSQAMTIASEQEIVRISQQQADQLVWDNRDEILARASYDGGLSTWTLHQLDQLKEPQPAQSLDRDRPEPDHKAPAQTESTTKRHGPRL
ncbi:MAG: hypothetical protein E6Z40_11080, partial [Bifidobacterium sp.]|nr:hypothetical protein [Bifidobacterium sp.]